MGNWFTEQEAKTQAFRERLYESLSGRDYATGKMKKISKYALKAAKAWSASMKPLAKEAFYTMVDGALRAGIPKGEVAGVFKIFYDHPPSFPPDLTQLEKSSLKRMHWLMTAWYTYPRKCWKADTIEDRAALTAALKPPAAWMIKHFLIDGLKNYAKFVKQYAREGGFEVEEFEAEVRMWIQSRPEFVDNAHFLDSFLINAGLGG